MSFYKRNRKEFSLILVFTFIKLALHFAANNNFGIHRDEFLYLALGEHLDWGFKEVPPFIAGISWLTTNVFGDSVFATRIISTIFGTFIVYLTGLTVLALGGKRPAIAIACLAVILSPAFLASGYLLQPVVFDQFFWVLSAYLIIRFIKTRQNIYLYSLGVAAGFGMLNKYSMALYILALLLGLLMTDQRKILVKKAFLISAAIALAIFLPNLIWQISHGFPVINHMNELKETQLNLINPLEFLQSQLFIHASTSLIWISGLIFLFVSRSLKPFRFLGLAFALVIILLILMHGKSYYSFGAYPVLFAAGGLAFCKLLNRMRTSFKYVLTSIVLLPSTLLIPIAIPILPFETTLAFFKYSAEKLKLNFILKWENQEYHATTQDYADMLAWEDLAIGARKAYQLIPERERRHTTIFASNYGQAGAVDHYRKKYGLPPTVCLNSSYALWSPDTVQTRHLIYIDNEYPDDLAPLYNKLIKISAIENPYAREKGTSVYLLSDPIKSLQPIYRKHRQEELD